MTTRIRVLIVAAIAATCYLVSPLSVNAQGPGAAAPGSVGFTLQFDENGNSLLNGGPNPFPVVPLAGGGINFYLPVPVVQGYVLVTSSVDVDPAHPSGDSDLMVFFNVPLPSGQMQGVMNYASLIDPGDPLQLADVNAFTFPQPVTTIGGSAPRETTASPGFLIRLMPQAPCTSASVTATWFPSHPHLSYAASGSSA